jgi:DNA-binding protein Fis
MLHVLRLFGNNRTRAAQALQVAENTLRKWVGE